MNDDRSKTQRFLLGLVMLALISLVVFASTSSAAEETGGVEEEENDESLGGNHHYNGASILNITEEPPGLSDAVNRATFPLLKDDRYVPPMPSASAELFHQTGNSAGPAKDEGENDEDVDLDLAAQGDDEGEGEEENYDQEQTQRLVALLGGEAVVNKSRKIKRQLKAVAKQWADAYRLRERYEGLLTEEVPMFPTTTVTTNVSSSSAEEEEEEASTETTVTVHSPWWSDLVPNTIYATTVPPLMHYPKQVKYTDLIKEAAKASRILKAELQQEELQGSAEEKPLLNLLIGATGALVPELAKTLRELEDHKRFHLNTMRAVQPVLEAAEVQLVEKKKNAESNKSSRKSRKDKLTTALDFDREMKKIKSLGKYVATKLKRGVGADLDTLQEMLYLLYSIRGKAAALHQDSDEDASSKVDFFSATSGAEDDEVSFPKTGLSGAMYSSSLGSPVTAVASDLVTLQGLGVMILVLSSMGFLLPWALWLLGFAIVIGVQMWRKTPTSNKAAADAKFREGGRKLGDSVPAEDGGAKGGGMTLGMVPYHVWTLTTNNLFHLVLQLVGLFLVLTVDRKYFFPFKGPGLSLTTTAFNMRHFFTPTATMVMCGAVLVLSWSSCRVALALLRRKGNTKSGGKRSSGSSGRTPGSTKRGGH